jgi:hypothetical protein
MFRGDDIVGIVVLYKLQVQPFIDKQIELVTTFADQAVIKIHLRTKDRAALPSLDPTL